MVLYIISSMYIQTRVVYICTRRNRKRMMTIFGFGGDPDVYTYVDHRMSVCVDEKRETAYIWNPLISSSYPPLPTFFRLPCSFECCTNALKGNNINIIDFRSSCCLIFTLFSCYYRLFLFSHSQYTRYRYNIRKYNTTIDDNSLCACVHRYHYCIRIYVYIRISFSA